MELLIKNSPNHYETGDLIDFREDGFQWSTGASQSDVFTILKGVDITEAECELLMMPDEQLIIPKSVLKNPIMYKGLINIENMQEIKRRRFTVKNSKLERK